MKKLFINFSGPLPTQRIFNAAMLFFRIAVSLEMIFVHGFKKLGIGVAAAESIPNPLHLPEAFNSAFAIAANIFFPFLVLIGLCTRLATLPTLAVTLTGYFVLHWNDAALVKDTPFIYSVVFMLILFVGPGKYSFDYIVHKKLLQ
ncbi:DoxX family protein [Ferruginibacter sp.]